MKINYLLASIFVCLCTINIKGMDKKKSLIPTIEQEKKIKGGGKKKTPKKLFNHFVERPRNFSEADTRGFNSLKKQLLQTYGANPNRINNKLADFIRIINKKNK